MSFSKLLSESKLDNVVKSTKIAVRLCEYFEKKGARMPNRQTHVRVGTLTGCGIAAYRAREQDKLNMLLEAVGGAIGGYFGSRLPDVIEPSSWPGHRQLAHSATAGTAVAFSLYELLGKWEELCRSNAEHYRQENIQDTLNDIEKLLCALMELALHIMAGALVGLAVGYLSHLALDGRTRGGLPILK